MPNAPRLLFPTEPPDPRRSLLQRLAIAAGIVMFIALLAYVGRDGYSDADGTPLSVRIKPGAAGSPDEAG